MVTEKSLDMIGSNPIGPNLIHSAGDPFQVVILSQSSPDSYFILIKLMTKILAIIEQSQSYF